MSTHGADAPAVPGYELGTLIGAGSSGTVWSATRRRDGAEVAVKVVSLDPPDGREAAARELAVLAGVEVEGLVGFHEAIVLEDDPARLALVLDRVRGGSLLRAVTGRGHLSAGESVTVLTPVARALAGLHAVGVVHGDVTPANVLLERSGRPLLADLGVARVVGDARGELDATEGFVAPELLDGHAPSEASDVYAVGALAWWCVTGSAPGPAAVRPLVSAVAPNLPAAWAEATAWALAGVPAARPTAAELALAYFDSTECEPLRLVVGHDDTSLLTRRLRHAAAEPAPPILKPRARPWRRWQPARHRRSRRGGAVAVGVLVVTTALAAGGVVVVRAAAGPLRAAPGTARSASPRLRPAPASSPTPASAAPRTDPASDRSAARGDPLSLMQSLATLRAQALASGSSATLAMLDAPASPALTQDTAALARTVAAGWSYRHVELRVTRARTVRLEGANATVEAAVDTSGYEVVNATMASWKRPVRGQALRFQLVWSAGRWRVRSVGRP